MSMVLFGLDTDLSQSRRKDPVFLQAVRILQSEDDRLETSSFYVP